MNWDEDIDVLVTKKSPPKQGRRAGHTDSFESTEQLIDNTLDLINDSPRDANIPRKTGGWADDGVKSAKSRSGANLIEEERFRDHINVDSDNDDIPVIPDLDDIQDELLSPQEMKTPAVLINKSTYKELDKELSAIQATNSELHSLIKDNNIDLSILTSKLFPQSEIKEDDEEWTMESLFNEIVSIKS